MYHYVYKLTCQKSDEYYFGSRSSKVHPSVDPYLGSMLSWNPVKSDLMKTIVRSDFTSRTDAVEYESSLIQSNINDVKCKNAHVPGKGFHTNGLGQYIDDRGSVHRVSPNDQRVISGEFKPFWSGRQHSEKSKQQMSESAKNRNLDHETELTRRNSISRSHLGRKKSKLHTDNIRNSKLGSKNPMYGKMQKRVMCDVCKREVAINMASRYHFDKCKFIGEA